MKVQVFGTECAACVTMRRNVDQAVSELGLACTVEHLTRISDLIDHGITGTPALKIDGALKSAGRSLEVAALKKLLTEAARGGGQ